jgi:Pyridoxamine 5'-phosphate oxidase
MSAKLMEYFNKQPRIGTLSTAGKDGKVDVAYFGSPRMTDEKTVIMAVRKNQTFVNLQENPNAVFMILEQASAPPGWKGVRVYLKMTGSQTSGEKLETMKKAIAQKAGEEMAKSMHAALTFEVQDVRPLMDVGQGWEKSI